MLSTNLPRENVIENRKSKIENGYVLLEDNEGSTELGVVWSTTTNLRKRLILEWKQKRKRDLQFGRQLTYEIFIASKWLLSYTYGFRISGSPKPPVFGYHRSCQTLDLLYRC